MRRFCALFNLFCTCRGPQRRCCLTVLITVIVTFIVTYSIISPIATSLRYCHQGNPYHGNNNNNAVRNPHESFIAGLEDLNISHHVDANLITNTAHYVWCGREEFEFRNYLSVLSVFKILRADKIVFHYTTLPKEDPYHYNGWFQELLQNIPILTLRPMKGYAKCHQNRALKLQYIMQALSESGGVYLHENLVLTNQLLHLRKFDVAMIPSIDAPVGSVLGNALDGVFLVQSAAVPKLDQAIKSMNYGVETKANCIYYPKFKSKEHICANIRDPIFPKDIWESDSDFAKIARKLFYGAGRSRSVEPFEKGHIPKISHYIWMGSKEVNFIGYLSVRSSLDVLKVKQVIIHGNGKPKGKWLENLLSDKRVKYMRRDLPDTIFGMGVRNVVHISNILRVDILLKYGGIYCDWDILWARPVDSLLEYPAVMGFDRSRMQYPSFPNFFSNNVIMSTKNSDFMHRYLNSLRIDHLGNWQLNALLTSYKVYERYPDSLYVSRFLQISCGCDTCTQKAKTRSKSADIAVNLAWKQLGYSLHYPCRTIPAANIYNGTVTITGKGPIVDIARELLNLNRKRRI